MATRLHLCELIRLGPGEGVSSVLDDEALVSDVSKYPPRGSYQIIPTETVFHSVQSSWVELKICRFTTLDRSASSSW